MADAWVPMAGIVAGGIFGYWIRTVEARRGDVISRLDDISKEVATIQEVAVKYWSKDRTEGDEATSEFVGLEGQMKGRLHIISDILARNDKYLSQQERAKIWQTLGTFHEITTGGSFGDRERSASPRNINKIFVSGALLTGEIRDCGRRNLAPFPEKVLIKGFSVATVLVGRARLHFRRLWLRILVISRRS